MFKLPIDRYSGQADMFETPLDNPELDRLAMWANLRRGVTKRIDRYSFTELMLLGRPRTLLRCAHHFVRDSSKADRDDDALDALAEFVKSRFPDAWAGFGLDGEPAAAVRDGLYHALEYGDTDLDGMFDGLFGDSDRYTRAFLDLAALLDGTDAAAVDAVFKDLVPRWGRVVSWRLVDARLPGECRHIEFVDCSVDVAATVFVGCVFRSCRLGPRPAAAHNVVGCSFVDCFAEGGAIPADWFDNDSRLRNRVEYGRGRVSPEALAAARVAAVIA